jgi:hypothetical protein
VEILFGVVLVICQIRLLIVHLEIALVAKQCVGEQTIALMLLHASQLNLDVSRFWVYNFVHFENFN